MYALCPYFTNDGTVGLFSRNDDDVYHSTYGALTESWQKFIIPSRLEEYLTRHNEVKILDICYGIGYNTKTALQVFINNFIENKKKKKISSTTSINIDSIYTNNISNQNYAKKNKNPNDKNVNIDINYNETVYADNTSCNFLESKREINCKKLLIDAVDLDKTLIKLSPFIKIEPKNNSLFKNRTSQKYYFNLENNKFSQIQKINKIKVKSLQKKLKLKNEVSLIILKKMLKSNPDIFNDITLQTILNKKKYTPFLNKFMINFNDFHYNQGYKYNIKKNNLVFLHNI